MQDTIQVLFVCMGNICRSPMAEGVFRKRVAEANLSHRIITDSAGTHAYHVGEPPDRRAQATSKERGVDISDLRARQVARTDFSRFHYVLAMDKQNFKLLMEACPVEQQSRVSLYLDFATGHKESEVPDPYYGGLQGFDHVYELVDSAAIGLLADIQQRYLAKSS
jgi:protein-tyrosine phosphatase